MISVYIYGVERIIKKFQWQMVFLGDSMEPHLCTNGSAGYLNMQLSVNTLVLFHVLHTDDSAALL